MPHNSVSVFGPKARLA